MGTRDRQGPDFESGGPSAETRALVVVTPQCRHSDGRGAPSFIAQLVACDRRLADYRQARQAEPARARGAYAGRPTPTRQHLDMSV